MEAALSFSRTYEAIIYLILGALALWEIRKFTLAWEEVRGAAFGLERESAQARLNRAAVMLVLILAAAMAEFILVSFVIPTVPGAIPLSTPTIDLLATPTHTLPASTPEPGEEAVPATMTPPSTVSAEAAGCIVEQLNITSPQPGDIVTGEVTLIGTVDLPNFGFYKYEIAPPDDPVWLTLQAGREVKHEAELGKWNTGSLAPGEYRLRLVAHDNEGQVLATCEIRVQIVAETTQ